MRPALLPYYIGFCFLCRKIFDENNRLCKGNPGKVAVWFVILALIGFLVSMLVNGKCKAAVPVFRK